MSKRRRSSSDVDDGRDFGKRFGRFVLWVAMLLGITLGVIVMQQVRVISPDALALAGGVVIGIVVMLVPLGLVAFGGWVVFRYMDERNRTAVRPSPIAQQPPVVIVSGGQMWPGAGGAMPNDWARQLPSPTAQWDVQQSQTAREFTVIGDD